MSDLVNNQIDTLSWLSLMYSSCRLFTVPFRLLSGDISIYTDVSHAYHFSSLRKIIFTSSLCSFDLPDFLGT